MKRELDDSWIGRPVVLRNGAIARVGVDEFEVTGKWKYRLFNQQGPTLNSSGRYWSHSMYSDFDIDWDRTERITEHLLGLLAELHPVEAMMLGPFCDAVGLGVDALAVNS